ncbi:MAG: tetratricopeptide repeat protein [Candidatus Omnitrophica bacterium]|nr:tetratricopeptide repeat protein [Candidatus Omnitrophota bacterium]
MRLNSPLLTLSLVFLLAASLSGCLRHQRNFYFGHYSDAERYYAKGEYEKAIEKYQAYRDENPEGNLAVIAHYYMAKSYQALGKNSEARAAYQEIKAKYPDMVWANFSETQLKDLTESDSLPETES